MFLKEADVSTRDTLNQLAGFTGLGWTTSVVVLLTTLIHSGNGPVSRLVVNPRVLLYLGAVFFVITLLLDRLTASQPPRRKSTDSPVSRGCLLHDDGPTEPAHGPSVVSSQVHKCSCISEPSLL